MKWIALEYLNVENWTKAPEMQVSALHEHKCRNPASIQKSAAHPEGEPLQFEGCLACLQREKLCNSLMPDTVCRVVSRL